MTFQEATEFRDKYRSVLKVAELLNYKGELYGNGTPVYDVIVADDKDAANVFLTMYDSEITNELALTKYKITDFEAFVIGFQGSWGDGNVYVSKLKDYIKHISL